MALLMTSSFAYSQDTLTVKQLIRQDNSRFLGYTALVMSPTVLFFTKIDRSDKFGKVVYGSFAAITIGSGVLSLCYSDHRKVLSYSLFFVAGFMDGFNEELAYHYPAVKNKMPFLNDQWFNPNISWQNKYNAGYPLSGTLLVGLTDAYHATRSLNKLMVVGGIFTFDKPKSLRQSFKKAYTFDTLLRVSLALKCQLTIAGDKHTAVGALVWGKPVDFSELIEDFKK